MKTNVKELPESKILLTVEASKEELQDDIKSAYKTVAKQYKIPGFRQGKIPSKIIDARIGKEVVIGEAIKTAVPRLYSKAVKETGILPISQPKIEVKELPLDGELKFDANVSVRPEIEVKDYAGVTVEMEKTAVSTAEIDERLDILRDKFSKLEAVKRPIKEGDFVLVDYDAYISDERIESMSANDYMIEVAEGTILPELKEKMVGAKNGDTLEVDTKVADDSPEKEHAGKNIKLKLLVKEIKEKKPPVADDDFAKQASEFDTLDELKKDIESKILEQKNQIYEVNLRQKVLDKAVENAKFELPKEMVELEADRMFKDFINSIESKGIKVDQYYQVTGGSEEAVKKQTLEEAEKLIKNELVLDKISLEEKIEVSKEELDEEIAKYAKAAKKPFDEYKKELAKKDSIYSIEVDLSLKKTLDWLVDKAKVIDKIKNKSDNIKSKKVNEKKPN